MTYRYQYARPAVTVDVILFNDQEELLLIKRDGEPFKGSWAFPGGFVDENEDLEIAARRELLEETCLMGGSFKQIGTYGKPGRDPRGHTISVVYSGKVIDADLLEAADDASEAKWFSLDDLPELAFDHQEIIEEFIANNN